MDKRGERKCIRTVMQGGQQRRSMWQRLLPCSKLWHQEVAGPCSSCCRQRAPASGTGGAFAGCCQQSDRFKKSTAVTATAILLTTFINQNKNSTTTINRRERAAETGKRTG